MACAVVDSRSPRPALPAKVEVEIDALDAHALLAVHADQRAQPAAAQQVAEEQETAMEGDEDDVTAQAAAPLSLHCPGLSGLSNGTLHSARLAMELRHETKHAAEKERVKQQERKDRAGCEQLDWYE